VARLAPAPQAQQQPAVEQHAQHGVEHRPPGDALPPQGIAAQPKAAGDLGGVEQHRPRVAGQQRPQRRIDLADARLGPGVEQQESDQGQGDGR
jgi:hypothetical protein